MQVQIDIGFDQLVQIAKKLPGNKWEELKAEVEIKKMEDAPRGNFEAFLLSAPVFTKKQLNTIAKTRKAINQWRKK